LAAQFSALDLVDRILTSQDEDEEQLRKRPSEAHHLARPDALPPDQTRDVEAGAIHELLEHERVLRFLDDLVVGVAELGRAVRQLERELEQSGLQHASYVQ